jgi:hypothetical protein
MESNCVSDTCALAIPNPVNDIMLQQLDTVLYCSPRGDASPAGAMPSKLPRGKYFALRT